MPLVLMSVENGCATLTLNRPEKLNALSAALFAELEAHIATIECSVVSIGVVVLKGAGRAFSAGLDLTSLKPDEHPKAYGRIVDALSRLPQPVIVAVQGVCVTGALELALAGDIIIASRSARFADTHAKWGLTPLWGMSQRLPRRIGAAKAKEMSFTCGFYDGEAAAAMGLANVCVADDLLDEEVARWTHDVGANSWFTHAAHKRLYRETDGLPIGAGLAYESHYTQGRAPDAADRILRFTRRSSEKEHS